MVSQKSTAPNKSKPPFVEKCSEVLFPFQKPDSIVDACQALSKARELRAQFEKKEKPLITAKVGIQVTAKVDIKVTAKEETKVTVEVEIHTHTKIEFSAFEKAKVPLFRS